MIKKKSLIFTAVFIVIISLILFCPVLNVLSVSSRKLESHLFYSIDGYTKGFVISYTHSVNKGRVHDYYKHTPEKKLELYKTSFVSYGAGIPEPEETPGARGLTPVAAIGKPGRLLRLQTLQQGERLFGSER